MADPVVRRAGVYRGIANLAALVTLVYPVWVLLTAFGRLGTTAPHEKYPHVETAMEQAFAGGAVVGVVVLAILAAGFLYRSRH